MLKTTDLKLIGELRDNSRETLTNISRKTKIPISTLYDKLKINKDSIIVKHTTLLDFAKMGFNCRANMMFRTNRENREKLASFLKVHPNINNLYKINNGFDFLAEGVFMHVKDMEDFLEQLDNKFLLEEKKTHYVIEDLKREEFLSKGLGAPPQYD